MMDGWAAAVTRGGWRTAGWSARSATIRPKPVNTTTWPATVPAVEHVLAEGLEFPAGLTVLVGENGSGKSTVVEMLAAAYGLNPAGGSAQAGLFHTRDTGPPGAGPALIVERGPGRPRWSYFLRADATHSLYSYLEDNPGSRRPGAISSAEPRRGFPGAAAHQGEPARLLPDGRA